MLNPSDVINANLHGANLRGADLTCANLAYASLTGADLREVNLTGANIWNTRVDLFETPEEYQYREDYSFTEEPFVNPLLLYEMTLPAMWE